ncbi:hypothetical protein LSG23_20545 (plasmid) [Bacillus velezensis]|uniref:hypothetical protein n=1 Tax=Bacillus velezensis TaxID=492670 RepID=UPI000987F963|nr:hypothetical protein [Bacillus velezensis]AQS42493.1 hypothetical protein BVH55_00425 [Bacillus velezensis]WNR83201.1 hypothetical protein RP314_20785 [Bacillus velezensis]
MKTKKVKGKIIDLRKKKDKFKKTLLKKLFDDPVRLEKSRMITKYGLDEGVERENEFLDQHLEKFRFKLFSFYCLIGIVILFLFANIISFWLPRLI